MQYKIEAWNQPEGQGNGWARCSDRKAERFFVFGDSERLPVEFRTRKEAKDYVQNEEHNSGRRMGRWFR